jgi:hypothetical protein
MNNNKKIKFNYVLYDMDGFTEANDYENPEDYDHVELILKNYFDGSDLMLAWNENEGRDNAYLFIGQFNSGKHGNVQS